MSPYAILTVTVVFTALVLTAGPHGDIAAWCAVGAAAGFIATVVAFLLEKEERT